MFLKWFLGNIMPLWKHFNTFSLQCVVGNFYICQLLLVTSKLNWRTRPREEGAILEGHCGISRTQERCKQSSIMKVRKQSKVSHLQIKNS